MGIYSVKEKFLPISYTKQVFPRFSRQITVLLRVKHGRNQENAGAPITWGHDQEYVGRAFGGTTRGVQHGLDWEALRLISPPNAGAGGGRTRPSITVVAEGEPGVPVFCCAQVRGTPARVTPVNIPPKRICCIGFIVFSP